MRSPIDAFDRRNLLTYASLACGLAAVAGAREGNASIAGVAMAVAVIADTFDGRFARRFRSDTRRQAIGAELDSLSDAATFGAAPVLCAMLLSDAHGMAEWLLRSAGCAYLACALTRLAFFNVTLPDNGGGFVGVPVPVAALIWSSTLLVHLPVLASVSILVASAGLMVAPVPIARPTGASLAVFTCWPLVTGIAHLLRLLPGLPIGRL
jgi:phosphatidylserine synthase